MNSVQNLKSETTKTSTRTFQFFLHHSIDLIDFSMKFRLVFYHFVRNFVFFLLPFIIIGHAINTWIKYKFASEWLMKKINGQTQHDWQNMRACLPASVCIWLELMRQCLKSNTVVFHTHSIYNSYYIGVAAFSMMCVCVLCSISFF